MKHIRKVLTRRLHFQHFAIIFLEVCRDFAASLCLTKEREAGAVASNGGNFSRNPPLMRSHLCPQQKDEWKKTSKIDTISVPYTKQFWYWPEMSNFGIDPALRVFPNHMRKQFTTSNNILEHVTDVGFVKFYTSARFPIFEILPENNA